MKLSEVLKDGIYVLKEKNKESNFLLSLLLKARLLLAFLLGKSKEYLIVNDKEELEVEKQIEYFSLLDRLISGEPLQYIIENQEFMGLDFFVNKNVLIPQPDTEILVEAVIKYLKHNLGKENSELFDIFEKPKINNPKVLDLCTGSGAIAISLSKKFENCNIDIYASDVSKLALDVAKINCQKNKANVKNTFKNVTLVSTVKLIESDLFNNINEKFDIIVSNPPYIETDTIKELDLDVQNEPHLALDGGKDGLDFYRKIAIEARKYLTNERNFIFRNRI